MRAAAWAALGAGALYTLVRAWRLTLDYYDGFDYLHTASRLLHEPVGPALEEGRPMLLSLLQAPIVALCRHFGPGNPWMLRGPHLLDAALSLGAAAALVVLLRRRFSLTLSLLGGALFVWGRAFVHYGAHTMTDLAVTGLCALTITLHLRAVRARTLGAFLLAGVVFGLAAAMKFSAPSLAVAILATELVSLVDLAAPRARGPRVRLHLDPRRRLGLVVEGLATLATFAAVQLGALVRLHGELTWPILREASASFSNAQWGFSGESWRDNLPMLVVILSWPVIVLAATGLLSTLGRPRRADVPFAAWLGAMGVALVFMVGHNETRYLFPIVPPVIYFALRGVEAALDLGRRAGRGGTLAVSGAVGLLVAAALAGGVAQAREDADPAFTADVHGRAARALAARRPGAPAYALGVFTTLAPATPGPLAEDEFWNTFHASPWQLSYLLGEAPEMLPGPNGTPATVRAALFPRLPDGACLVRFAGSYFDTHTFPKGPHRQALEAWTVRRHDLALVPGVAPDDARRFSEPGAAAAVELHVQGGGASLVGVPPGGPWWIYTKTSRRPWTFAGATATPAFELADAAQVDGVALVHVDVERFE